MDDLIEAHSSDWGEAVRGLIINRKERAEVIFLCNDETMLPVFQDDLEGSLWEVLGGYDSLIIVDQEGVCAHRFSRADIENNGEEIVTIVNYLLAET